MEKLYGLAVGGFRAVVVESALFSSPVSLIDFCIDDEAALEADGRDAVEDLINESSLFSLLSLADFGIGGATFVTNDDLFKSSLVSLLSLTDFGIDDEPALEADGRDAVEDFIDESSLLFLLLSSTDFGLAAAAVVDADDGDAVKDLLVVKPSLFLLICSTGFGVSTVAAND